MSKELLQRLHGLNEDELRRELTEILTRQRLGLVWEHSAIERDQAINANVVLPRLDHSLSHNLGPEPCQNLIIEGDNFDSLRLLRATHANKIRVIYIDPPYNTGNKDWVYNDRYAGKNDRWRHSQWLEFLYQRLILARDLLTPDGVVLVSINEENRARLELLMDDVFPGRKLGSFVWKTRSGSNDEQALFSVDHEYVLVYAQPGFKFRGEAKDFAQYKNPDNDPRGPWKTGDLGKGHTRAERPNAYYPILNPRTGVWYPCNPSVVWRFASETRVKDVSTLRAKSMEQYIREDKVIFPDPSTERVVVWKTMAELHAAIANGDVPLRPKTKVPLLTMDLPDLDFWIGKPVGFGRPWFKRHLRDVQSDLRPISSWIRGAVEDDLGDDLTINLMAQRSGTGEHSANEILGSNAFPYPKPLSLIKALLEQASGPNDIVLDFFAGSGTTGHAVAAINAADGGHRQFILCSSTESNSKDPGRNICRDITAERIRRVLTGYGNTPGLGGSFAYLAIDLMDVADVQLDAGAHQITQLLSLRLQGAAIAPPSYLDHMIVLAASGDIAAVYLPNVTREAIDAAVALPHRRLLVFSSRPDTVQELIEAAGKLCDSRAVGKEIVAGQAGMEQTDLRARTQIEESL
jgi:adenine-specific DNA-methyltransferase